MINNRILINQTQVGRVKCFKPGKSALDGRKIGK